MRLAGAVVLLPVLALLWLLWWVLSWLTMRRRGYGYWDVKNHEHVWFWRDMWGDWYWAGDWHWFIRERIEEE